MTIDPRSQQPVGMDCTVSLDAVWALQTAAWIALAGKLGLGELGDQCAIEEFRYDVINGFRIKVSGPKVPEAQWFKLKLVEEESI